ncbi:hypothetical protein KDH_71130 [Dictyobacter sp. S3.2.2.5]|uniref:N-acetyltransferase domain-containing protein n=1 Tax=Dictyobacter halimunensis TaxID=3026934 RepID=A0ABQ6G1B5_9CHLR|nr:hypothetical protein KDH_71130 [Dictyobacter sp. S3.2.2.5]
MSQTFSLLCAENAVPRKRTLETATATLFLQDFCTAPFVESLRPDAGLRAFTHRPELEHQLLGKISQRADSILTLAYTRQGVIVGQVTLTPADDYWQGLANTYEIAIEVSAGWRKLGIALQLLKLVFELHCLDELIILGMGFSWHWDTDSLGLTRFAYRAVIERLFARYGFAEYLTAEQNIRMDPANIFLARIGRHVAAANLSQFYNRLLHTDTLLGM